MYRIGIDVGGTFTDVTLLNEESGYFTTYKLSSTPQDQSIAIMNGAKEVLELNKIEPSKVNYFGHGTTVATNMIIEKNGAKTALLTTKGFKDLLEIGRQTRPSIYNIFEDKPETLVPRSMCLEVMERTNSKGEILKEVDPEEAKKLLIQLKEAGVESLAVCFLFSFFNEKNEKVIEECIKEVWPEVYYSLSSDVLPEFREFERMSTTVINSYLGPKMEKYIDALKDRIKSIGIKVEPYITQSNGGVMSIESTIDSPIQTALSGPSAGVVGAIYIAKLAGFDNIITYDMGGTSTDVSLVTNGQAEYTTKRKIAGLPSGVPMIDVYAVGAGGGSIGYLDNAGALKVGPQSAGADPGPAAYGLGGENPVVTDANLVLGYLNPDYVLGGRLSLNRELSVQAIRKKIADPMGISVEEAAQGIIKVVNSNMARGIRVITVEKGQNPSDFALVAYGGAGPLHAVRLGQEMGIKNVIIPPTPGVLCALGLLTADIKRSYVKTILNDLDELNIDEFNRILENLLEQGNEWLDSEGVKPENRLFRNIAEMRYKGQNYELHVTVPVHGVTQSDIQEIKQKFFKEHEKNYGYYDPNNEIQIVNVRSEAIGLVEKPKLKKLEIELKDIRETIVSEREVYFEETGKIICPIYDRSKIGIINAVKGPCIIEQMDSTTVIPPNTIFDVDQYGNIIVDTEPYNATQREVLLNEVTN